MILSSRRLLLRFVGRQQQRRRPTKSVTSSLASSSSLLVGKKRTLSSGNSAGDQQPPPPDHHQQHYHHGMTYPPFSRDTLHGEFGSYIEHYDKSISIDDSAATSPGKNKEQFWADAASKLYWFEEPTKTIQQDPHRPYFYHYFPDGQINTSYNCLDVHVKAGRGHQPAIIYDSPVTDTKYALSYEELLEQVSLFAGALKDQLGIVQGDRVVIYMPMIPQAIIAMLACTRIGAVHSVVFGGFASAELASRIDDSQPKVVIAATAGVEPTRIVPYKPLLEKALELSSHQVERVVVVQRPNITLPDNGNLGPIDVEYDELMAKAKPTDAMPLPSNHPHYVL